VGTDRDGVRTKNENHFQGVAVICLSLGVRVMIRIVSTRFRSDQKRFIGFRFDDT